MWPPTQGAEKGGACTWCHAELLRLPSETELFKGKCSC